MQMASGLAMPRYDFTCQECSEEFEVFQGFNDTAQCPKCGSEHCKKSTAYSFSVNLAQGGRKPKVGQRVNDFIKEAKEELKEQHNKLREDR
jgi:putative FmdB family regulatory protein